MKFLILLSLLSTGIFEASGGSLNGNSLTQSINSLLASLHIPGYGNARSALEAPTPQIVYLNTRPVNIARRAEDDSVVIDANEEPIAVDRYSSGVTSSLQNVGSSITGKFGNLVAKSQRLLGLGSSRNAAFNDVNGLSRGPQTNDDLINQIITNQMNAFFGTIREVIRARIQNITMSLKFKRRGASNSRSEEVTELQHEVTAFDILYQIFQNPQTVLQMLPQLLGQTGAENRQAGFDSSAYGSGVTNLFNRTWTKPGGIGWKNIWSSSSSSGTSGMRRGSLSGLASSLKPSISAPPADSRLLFAFPPLPITTTTTTTEVPVNESKGTRLVNRLLSKTGLGGNGAGSIGK